MDLSNGFNSAATGAQYPLVSKLGDSDRPGTSTIASLAYGFLPATYATAVTAVELLCHDVAQEVGFGVTLTIFYWLGFA